MAMVGAATDADDAQVGPVPSQGREGGHEVVGVAFVDRCGLVEFGVTLGRGVGSQAAQAAQPRSVGFEPARQVAVSRITPTPSRCPNSANER